MVRSLAGLARLGITRRRESVGKSGQNGQGGCRRSLHVLNAGMGACALRRFREMPLQLQPERYSVYIIMDRGNEVA